ncbi:MAG: hypothetical protein V1855_03360 [bacterium]
MNNRETLCTYKGLSMRTKIAIFIVLNIFGFILATLGNISSPIFWGTTYFWPAAVIETVAGILFGWTGVSAVVTFSILANLVTDPTHFLVWALIIPGFLESYLPFYFFKKLNCDIKLKGIKAILIFTLFCALIPQLCGAISGVSTYLLFGKIKSIKDFFMIFATWPK